MPANDIVHQPNIQNYINISLTSLEREVLVLLFAEYEALVLKAEFGGGFGGGRVLLIRPIATSGAELPTVVKLGSAQIIQQEWEAFVSFVHKKVPKVAQIVDKPVFTKDGKWGGIRYPLAGDGQFQYESLGDFCLDAKADDVSYVLDQQLFPSLGTLWQDTRVIPEFFLARSLDSILPVNLVVAYTETSPAATMLQPQQILQVGEETIISNFVVTEVASSTNELTLDLPYNEDEDKWLGGGFRIRITDVPDVNKYQLGQLLPQPIIGRVQATRYTWIQSQVERIFPGSINSTKVTVSLPEVGVLPNPLEYLADILKQTHDVRVGVIHGDLNLENILVEFDERSRNIYLIDFAKARKDWILHDLLRLETSFWLYLVSAELVEKNGSFTDLQHVLFALHINEANLVHGLGKSYHILMTVRRMVRHLLVNHKSWDEYYYGLIVYLLGALKFKNLDTLPSAPLPKKIAFFVAACLLNMLQAPVVIERVEGAISVPSMGRDRDATTNSISDTLQQLRIRLTTLEEFKTQEDLQNIFDVSMDLHPFRDRLPDARNARSRANKTVAYLQGRFNTNQENALVLFLHVLANEYEGAEHIELNQFADQLERLLPGEKDT